MAAGKNVLNQFLLHVYRGGQLAHSVRLSEPLVLGRRNPSASAQEPGPFGRCRIAQETDAELVGLQKLVIAERNETLLSRTQVLVELIGESRVRITNLSRNVGLLLNGQRIAAKGERSPDPPWREVDLAADQIVTQVEKADVSFRIEMDESVMDGAIMTLEMATLAPGQTGAGSVALVDLLKRDREITAAELAKWMLNSMSVFHKGANALEMLTHATDSLAKVIGLDYVAGLTLDEDTWNIRHEHQGQDKLACPSTRLLRRIAEEKRSFRCLPKGSQSQAGVASVVAAPILSLNGDVFGALYGDRRTPDGPISELEQMVVELVASGTANGIARLEQQKAAMRAQIQFEEFFGATLAEELKSNPKLLEGKEADVTVLFCDIRGFSRISERVGPAGTLRWINDVLNQMSECVVQTDGVLVDYVGDELMAMWGAPHPLPDHAARACAAACQMRARLDTINQRWEPEVGVATDVAIGINSGIAIVGNTGSELKFKYGPMGTTVNLASRICSATKVIKRRLLITGHTQRRLVDPADTRRLCTVEVNNIGEPVDVFEVATTRDEDWDWLREQYQSSLGHFERGEFTAAVEQLGNVIKRVPHDDPSVNLLQRSVTALMTGPAAKHPIWVLASK